MRVNTVGANTETVGTETTVTLRKIKITISCHSVTLNVLFYIQRNKQKKSIPCCVISLFALLQRN